MIDKKLYFEAQISVISETTVLMTWGLSSLVVTLLKTYIEQIFHCFLIEP